MMPYFRPKRFEFRNDKIIYEFIGIKTFKKYLITNGDLVQRWRKKNQLDFQKAGIFEELYKFEKQTRRDETIHLIGITVVIIVSIIFQENFSLFDWLFILVLNLYINIYPIFLQRYNRIRILKILKKGGQPNPYGNFD